MSDIKNRELATSATSKIYEKVNTALSKYDSDKRWFWELLQNAKDTVVHSKGKVDVRVIISKNEENEPFVRFEHNGDHFKPSNHRFKFDDPKCLLLADSGKIEEDETQREDITGQFGTGFLSTHILSLRILVEGIFLDKENQFNSFSFELDRRYSNKFDLAEKVEKSLNQYDSNFKPIQHPFVSFPTKFTYFLTDNKESLENGFEVVKKGIKGIDNFIPFVLAFCKEVNSVEIIDDLNENQSTLFSRTSDLQKQDKLVQVISINKKICDIQNNTVSENLIEIAICSDLAEHIDVAIEVEKTEMVYKLKPIELELPVLFSSFPLVGSEKWRFPVMVNCTKFFPKTERDGILLLSGKDNGNQFLIEKSIECYEHLLDYFIAEKFQNLFLIAQTSYDTCPTEWTSEEWYKGVFRKIRKSILKKKLVAKENGEFILLEETLFPFTLKDKLDNFWDICNEFIGSFIPQKKDIAAWKEIINTNYSLWEVNLKYDIDRLLKEIESHESLTKLAKDKFNENESLTINWLNKVIYFVLFQIEKPDLFKSYKIVPNQLGKFSFIDDNIHFDNGIPRELKNLLDPFHEESWSYNKLLIDQTIIGFESHFPFSTKDISEHLNKLIKKLISDDYVKIENDPKGIYRGLFYRLISFFPDHDFSERMHLYELSLELLPDNSTFEKSIVKNLEEFDFSACNDWILKSLTEQVSKIDKGNLEGLQNINEKFKNKNQAETINWLDDYIVFIANFENKKHKDLLENFAIIPNQNEIFCPINKLNKDKDIPYDLIKIAESSHIGHIWTNELLHNELANTKSLFDEKSTITIDDIATEINSAIRDYDGDKQNRDIAELVFLLNESETVNNSKHRKLFSDFHSKRDSLIVGTLGEGEALSNVAKLIQNPDKLAILASLAENKNISKGQLEEFGNILTSENISIAAILDFAKSANGQPNQGLTSFDGFDISSDAEESIWKKIAMFFIETLKEAGINNVNTYLHLLHKIKNNEILVRSDTFTSHFESENFDKVAYKAEITAIAIEKVISYLTCELNYEILEFDSEYPTIMKIKRHEKEFMIVIRPSNGQRYQLHKKERETLSNKEAELWLSNGVYVIPETFYTLSNRIFSSGTAFIPLESFAPGRLLGH
jgi:hypothetical protein